ncbi:class I SAM-dependent methyltransferase [bacterium]|nr:class I SAM-dependent methyltransferase [bacterium]
MPDWNELFNQDDLVLKDPHPAALRFTESLKPGSVVLDLGCGGGRHLLPLLKAGHSPVGTDISLKGLAVAHHWVKAEFPDADVPLLPASMLELPFAAENFDSVLSVNVLNHGTKAEMQLAFEEVHRVLKPGGKASIVIISDEDSRCGMGDHLEERTWVPTEGIEAGIPHHYSNKGDLLAFCASFKGSTPQFTLHKKSIEEAAKVEQGIIPQSWGQPVKTVAHWEMSLRK